MIKNIVFDIGNVLVSFGWKEFYGKFNMTPEEFERVANATVHDPVWNEIDRGVMSDEEVLEEFVKNDPGVEELIRKTYENYKGLLTIYEYTKGWIIDLQKRGYKVFCLSNMSNKAVRECDDALNFVDMLDGYILSCNVKLIKPDRKIYEMLLDKYSLKADECLFIDDLKRNVDAAKEVGMNGVVFESVKKTEEALAKFENADNFVDTTSRYTKPQRAAALATVIVIGVGFLLLLVSCFIRAEWVNSFRKALLGLVIVLPCLAWAFVWMIGKMRNKHTMASFDLFSNSKKLK